MALQPFQQRVVDEKNEVSDRLSKLYAFFQTPTFAGLPEAERARLRSQARFMDGYAAVLEERIAAFLAAQPVDLWAGDMADRGAVVVKDYTGVAGAA